MEEREDGGSQEHPLPAFLYYARREKSRNLKFCLKLVRIV